MGGAEEIGVWVCVQDNGRPFMPPPPEVALPGRRGVANIRNRVTVLGARCAWQPLPGGTLFKLWLPLSQHYGQQQKKSGQSLVAN